MQLFLEQLFTSGEVTVLPPGVEFRFDAGAVVEIHRFDRAARLELAGQTPCIDMSAAKWAAKILAESARLTLARNLGEEEIARVYSVRCPHARSVSVDYSVDLFFRYLPGLVNLIERLAGDDPLLGSLRQVGRTWPLSSVGMKEIQVASIEPFFSHPGLRQLYIDRIFDTGDLERLSNPHVAEAVRTALGAHPELSPMVAAAAGVIAGAAA